MQRSIELFPKQEDFIFSEATFSAYGGGFGNGKTLSGCIKAHQHCQQKDAFFLIGRRHATDLEDSTLRDFLDLFGHMGKYSPGRKAFRFYKDGKPWSEVIFRHLDDMQSLTNMNLSGFWIDQAEEVSEDAFDFLVGRIRRPVQRREGFITFNPAGHDWIWRRFLKHVGRDGKALPNLVDYHLVMASTLENKKNLPEDYVRGLMSQPKAFVKRFVEGSFDTFSGQIYEEFREGLHVIQPFVIPSTWEKIRGIDHGQSGEHATGCLWMAMDYMGNCFIYQEYKKYNDIVSSHAKMIKQMSKVRQDGQIVDDHYSYTVIDPSTHAKNKVSKAGVSFSVADEYLEYGIATIGGQNDVIAGINRVKEFLKVDPDHYHPFIKIDDEPIKGAPHLYIFSSCTELIEEIQQYKWKQAIGMSTNTESDDPAERPRKKNDHLCFAKDTLILTTKGSKPIQNMKIGDYVVTPFGKSKVLSFSKTGYQTLFDYGKFIATSNHPVLSSKGISSLDTLRYNSYIWNQKEFLKPFTLMEYLIAGILTQEIKVKEFILDALLIRSLEAQLDTYTETSGHSIKEKFLKDITFIIRTDTTTTRLRALNLLLKKNMYKDMPGVIGMDRQNILAELENLLKNGINQQKGKSGIDSKQRLDGKIEYPLIGSVTLAVENMVLSSLVEASTVLQLANPENLGEEEVYNIATEHGMYFANGILVSNCDPLRYLIMSRPQKPQHMTSIAPWVFQNPIELARRAQSMGMTVDDLINQRYGNTTVRHSIGVNHSSGISHSDGSGIRHSSGIER